MDMGRRSFCLAWASGTAGLTTREMLDAGNLDALLMIVRTRTR